MTPVNLGERRERLAQEVRAVADVLDGRVDLVRDPGREPADRLQLLRLQELPLRAPGRRHVEEDRDRAGDPPLGVPQGAARQDQPGVRPVGPAQPELDLARFTPGDRCELRLCSGLEALG